MANINPPWTDEQVKNLEEWQKTGWLHPFTCCGHEGCLREESVNEGILIPTNNGLVCPCGKYTQNWASQNMLDGNIPPNPIEELLKRKS